MQNKRNKINSIRSRSVEYAQFGMFRMISRILYVCSGGVLIISFWFLYTRMYNTIGQVESLVAITPFAKVQVLNMTSYDTVQSIIVQKKSQELPVLLRDPFNVADSPILIENNVPVSTSTSSTIDVSSIQN